MTPTHTHLLQHVEKRLLVRLQLAVLPLLDGHGRAGEGGFALVGQPQVLHHPGRQVAEARLAAELEHAAELRLVLF
jgi:hypothetical protein